MLFFFFSDALLYLVFSFIITTGLPLFLSGAYSGVFLLGSSFIAFHLFSFSAFRVKSGRGEADPLCDHAGPDRASTPILFLSFIFCSVCTLHPRLAQNLGVEAP